MEIYQERKRIRRRSHKNSSAYTLKIKSRVTLNNHSKRKKESLWQPPNGYVRDDIIINNILNIVGNGYLNLIKMTIIPFVFTSLVMGISSATDVKQVGRIGGKILLIYVATTVIASAFGILGGLILKPGVGVDLGSFDLSNTYENVSTSFASVVLDFIPTNIVNSFAEGKMIHIVVFAVFFGIALSLIGKKAEAVKSFNESLANTMLKIVNIVMQLTPTACAP